MSKKEDAFEVSAVVNWLLKNFDSNQFKLTNMKIQKLVYFLHGVSLARRGVPLVRNKFEAWEHGPVVPSLYHRLKRYEKNIVSAALTYMDYETGCMKEVSTDGVDLVFDETLRKAAHYFISKEASWLRAESHEFGGPWEAAYLRENEGPGAHQISDIAIREHFENKYGGRRLH